MNELYNSLIDKINTKKKEIEDKYNTKLPMLCPYCNTPTNSNIIIHDECIEPYEKIIKFCSASNVLCKCGNTVNNTKYRCPICYTKVHPISYKIFVNDLISKKCEMIEEITINTQNNLLKVIDPELPIIGKDVETINEIQFTDYGIKNSKTDDEIKKLKKNIDAKEREIKENTRKRDKAKESIEKINNEIEKSKGNKKLGLLFLCISIPLIYFTLKLFFKYGPLKILSPWGVGGFILQYTLLFFSFYFGYSALSNLFDFNADSLKNSKANDITNYKNEYNNYNDLITNLTNDVNEMTTKILELGKLYKIEKTEYENGIKAKKSAINYIKGLTIDIDPNSIVNKIQIDASNIFNDIRKKYNNNDATAIINLLCEFRKSNITAKELTTNIKSRFEFLPKIELDDFCKSIAISNDKYLAFEDLENAVLYYLRLEGIIKHKIIGNTNSISNQFRNSYYNAINTVLTNKNIDLTTFIQMIYAMIPSNITFNDIVKNNSIFACQTEQYVMSNSLSIYHKSLNGNDYTEKDLNDMRNYIFYIITDLINTSVKIQDEKQEEYKIEQENKRLEEIEEQRQHEMNVANIYRESAEYEAEQARYEAEQSEYNMRAMEANARAISESNNQRVRDLEKQNYNLNRSLNKTNEAIEALNDKLDNYEKKNRNSMLDPSYAINEQRKAELWAKTLNKK
jgi:septal ring factor EnvC (AmiA/AmiB activator)